MILLQVLWWNNILQNLRFYCSTCSISNRVYYFYRPVRKGSQLRTFFIYHNHGISLCSVDWCVCLQSIHYFTCWSCFCACFLPGFLISHCYNPSVCYSWNFHLVLYIISIWMHVMTALSDSSYAMAIFRPIPGFFKRALYDARISHPLWCLELITSRMNFYLLLWT